MARTKIRECQGCSNHGTYMGDTHLCPCCDQWLHMACAGPGHVPGPYKCSNPWGNGPSSTYHRDNRATMISNHQNYSAAMVAADKLNAAHRKGK